MMRETKKFILHMSILHLLLNFLAFHTLSASTNSVSGDSKGAFNGRVIRFLVFIQFVESFKLNLMEKKKTYKIIFFLHLFS